MSPDHNAARESGRENLEEDALVLHQFQVVERLVRVRQQVRVGLAVEVPQSDLVVVRHIQKLAALPAD
jgi:hypothetical protein